MSEEKKKPDCFFLVCFAGRPADEELPADMPEQDKTFSYPLFASPPLQQEYFPGNFI